MSPVLPLRPSLPPGSDPLHDGGKAYAEQLVRSGVSTRYENYDDMVHGFMTFQEIDRARDAIADVADDLADALAVPASASAQRPS